MSKNLFGAHKQATLLCGDHLVRGSGPQNFTNACLFTAVEVIITCILVWECLFGGSRVVVGCLFGEGYVAKHGIPQDVESLKACALLYTTGLYTLHVVSWTLCLSHTNTVQTRSLFLIFWYHIFLHCSQPVVAILPYSYYALPDWMWWAGTGLATVCFSLEMLADLQMSSFKAKKLNAADSSYQLEGHSRILDKGLWAYSRHPNYLFNAIGVFGIGLTTGCLAYAFIWLGIQVFWVYAQSGSAHEEYMARKYGAEWMEYTRRTSFFVPFLPF